MFFCLTVSLSFSSDPFSITISESLWLSIFLPSRLKIRISLFLNLFSTLFHVFVVFLSVFSFFSSLYFSLKRVYWCILLLFLLRFNVSNNFFNLPFLISFENISIIFYYLVVYLCILFYF